MKKTLIALMALAGVAAADTTALTLENFNSQLTTISKLNPTEYTLTLTIGGSDFNGYGSGYILQLAENWGVFTQAGNYVAMENTDANDRAWVTASTISADKTVYTWTSSGTTTDTLLDSWVSKDTNGGNAQPGIKGMSITLDVTEAGSVVTLGMTNGTTSIIETGYVVDLSDIKLIMDTGEAANQGVSSITNASLTYTVPEPTTATLSLLALAGLAARRRRR